MKVSNYHFITTEERIYASEYFSQLMRNAGMRPLKRIRNTSATTTDWYTEMSTSDRYNGQVKIKVLYSYTTKVACAVTSPLLRDTVNIVQWLGYSDTTNRQIFEWTNSIIKEFEDSSTIREAVIVKIPSTNYYGSRKNPIKFNE